MLKKSFMLAFTVVILSQWRLGISYKCCNPASPSASLSEIPFTEIQEIAAIVSSDCIIYTLSQSCQISTVNSPIPSTQAEIFANVANHACTPVVIKACQDKKAAAPSNPQSNRLLV